MGETKPMNDDLELRKRKAKAKLRLRQMQEEAPKDTIPETPQEAQPKPQPTFFEQALPRTMANKDKFQTVIGMDGKPYQTNVGLGDLAGDVTSYASRWAGSALENILPGDQGRKGKTFAEGMANPEAGILKPVRDEASQMIEDPESTWAEKALGGVNYLGATVLEDPTLALNKAVTKVPSLIKKAIPNKVPQLLGKGAKRVQNTILRPRTQDVRSGYSTNNVFKYGIQGSLDEVLEKSQAKISEASNNLNALIKEGKDNGARINVKDAIRKAHDEMYKTTTGKVKNAGSLLQSKRAFKELDKIADEVGGTLDLENAQYFKQSLGDMGNFEFLASKKGWPVSKDESALSKLATKVNLILKKNIEDVAPDGVKAQNKIMSDLMPIRSTAQYRKIIAERNNPISLSDMLGAMATIGGGPKGWALWGAVRGQKSGKTVKVLKDISEKLQKTTDPKQIERYSKALEKLGMAKAGINAIRSGNDLTKSPEVGQEMEGYIFQGGDPADQKSWSQKKQENTEGQTKTNSSGDKIIFRDGKWQLM